jgi:hypothetical protein
MFEYITSSVSVMLLPVKCVSSELRRGSLPCPFIVQGQGLHVVPLNQDLTHD